MRIILKMAFLFVVAFVAMLQTGAQTVADHSSKKKKGLRVLVIGDSNTEIGNITMPLKAIMDSVYGNYGTGFCTLNPNSMGRVPDSLTVLCDSNWFFFDMRNDFKPAPGPYYSPNGLSISSSTPGALTTVHFSGDAVDLYYLQSPQGGRFSVRINGVQKKIIDQRGNTYQTKKIELKGLEAGKQEVIIKNISGKVTLVGVDAYKLHRKKNFRSILHKWGNAWASSTDYLNINEDVFCSALCRLNPNRIIILLGTNDHNLDRKDPEDFKSNLKELILRIKKALPDSKVMIVSTFTPEGKETQTILHGYLTRSFPEAAKETHSSYWDMNSWVGSYDPQKLPDGIHVNAVYGKLIAVELYKQLLLLSTKN